ncbi:hypothetical protein FSPOR_3076 [Fusarium sporotrichioides]|uniref:Laccase n=1 Tax=Fusarium sporotrichioides TaxID=5514 RepID=A0A395SHV4_FUSSP|nr:hypothetical protein FSPOR_3076 [Fusarium sporotrichioides]
MSPAADYGSSPSQHILGRPKTTVQHAEPDFPVFNPPPVDPGDAKFVCEYPEMEGFVDCSIAENRECWLRHPDGREFNIHTNYEKFAPIGIMRNYTLTITDESFNADGQNFAEAKLFNKKYPGPWLEACWGDVIINNMSKNGTSIHWHGIRQNQTMDMDGVNGVTQCPIAPGDSFNYVFKTTQYGTSWYHSHYSVQYADGLQGPITIHGPQSAPYDATKPPLLMTDWSHESAFKLLFPGSSLANRTFLLNGAGNISHYNNTPTLEVPKNYELYFNKTPTDRPRRPKRYLLRLINTSFESTFIFSIDNHWLQIVTSDFVPIEPYFNTSVLIGIGQRYNVIVEANPLAGDVNEIPEDGNFWIRTWVAKNCGSRTALPDGPYERTGILRYNHSDTALPSSQPWVNISMACSDETYSSLRPKLPWYVGPAANARTFGDDEAGERFNVTFNGQAGSSPEFIEEYPVAAFGLQRPDQPNFRPLQINYSDPVMMHLDESHQSYPEKWVVIPEDYTETDWVYFVLTMQGTANGTGAHPVHSLRPPLRNVTNITYQIHLHGHDFALLQQEETQVYDPSKLNLKLDNPPRRDVVLLPSNGFVVIAFKADNPGVWLMHCHIARHASEGLAMQVLERQSDANKLFPVSSLNMIEADRVCQNWKAWQHSQEEFFEGDSGI